MRWPDRVSVWRKLHEHRAATYGAPTWPCGCAQPFAGTTTGNAVRTKNAPGRAPFGRARLGRRFDRVLVPAPTAARSAVGGRPCLERPTRSADVAHSPDAHGRSKTVGGSLADHPSDGSSFVIRLDRHAGHTSRPLLAGFAECCPGQPCRFSRSKHRTSRLPWGRTAEIRIATRDALRTSNTISVQQAARGNFRLVAPRLNSTPSTASADASANRASRPTGISGPARPHCPSVRSAHDARSLGRSGPSPLATPL